MKTKQKIIIEVDRNQKIEQNSEEHAENYKKKLNKK